METELFLTFMQNLLALQATRKQFKTNFMLQRMNSYLNTLHKIKCGRLWRLLVLTEAAIYKTLLKGIMRS